MKDRCLHLARSAPGCLTEIRMNKAIQLLKNKDIPINGIASMLGYSSTYYFNKVFLETFTFSPESFRKRIFQT